MSFVELMVVIVILAFGILGLAATADSAQRAMTRARQKGDAASRAAATVDSLRRGACGVVGSARGGAGEQSWIVEVAGAGAIRHIEDSVRVNGKRFTVEGVVICP